jgi:type II secretory pathway component PulF
MDDSVFTNLSTGDEWYMRERELSALQSFLVDHTQALTVFWWILWVAVFIYVLTHYFLPNFWIKRRSAIKTR